MGEPMVAPNSVINFDILVQDLRRSVEYASRAGLLRDREVLDAIKAAEQTIRTDADPNVHAVVLALNAVAQAIAPMTVADLTFGRDPLTPDNQRRAKTLQFWLTVFCLLILVLVGYSMNALRVEQSAIAELTELQELHPETKLTALRMIAQNDLSQSKQEKFTALLDEYHQRASELKQINDRMASTYTRALEVSNIPLFPLGQYPSQLLAILHTTREVPAGQLGVGAPETPLALNTASPLQSGATRNQLRPASDSAQSASTAFPEPKSSASDDEKRALAQAQELCAEDADGSMSLPLEAAHYPKWMRTLLSDTLSDFCFQLKVLSPEGQGTVLTQSMTELGFVPHIKDKVSLRVTWFLPFLYGLLGSAVFMMRNVASIRTPAMEWFPIVMRLSLGGVAGIVMGWFSVTASPGIQSTTSLSVPFALAFLTGYGIDALFTLLDRLNRTIGDAPKSKAA
jgi:hypothetical protein